MFKIEVRFFFSWLSCGGGICGALTVERPREIWTRHLDPVLFNHQFQYGGYGLKENSLCFHKIPRFPSTTTNFQSRTMPHYYKPEMSAQASNATTKAAIRQRIWDHIEKNDLANFPRPVYHRIPNFKGANAAGEKVIAMDIFKKARTVKVNPDKPQEWVRYKTLEERKMLLVPTPRLKTGLFNRIVPPPGADTAMLKRCATREGITNYSTPVGLDHKINIDLIVIGSVAVSPKGYRLGKGEGYADMEYAMMVTMGAVNQDTVVVSTVHDCQVVDIPDEPIDEHDLMVDYIVTPTQVITCDGGRRRPTGIQWSKVTHQMLKDIPVLKDLREKERRLGRDVLLKE